MNPAFLATGLTLLAAAAGAADPSPAPSAPPAPCSAPEYRQFDFWVGDWDVYNAKGALAGHNLVTREYGGCVLQEHWAGSGTAGQTGSSFNTWSPGKRQWHQTWVDSTGGLLLLDGELTAGTMVLAGDVTGPDGAVVRHRITWSRKGEGQVRQLWEASSDQGRSWKTVFDGTYVPHKAG